MNEENDGIDAGTEEWKKQSSGNPWSKVFWLFIVLIGSGLIVFLAFIWLGRETVKSTNEAVVEIVTQFKPEKVVETFTEWKELTAEGTEGNILEVATATATESFSRKTTLEMFGKELPLGTTVSEISVPATYRFHIDLKDDWFVTHDGNRILVLAPEIRPTLPVAFDTSGVQKKTKSGWARWDGAENLDALEKTITPSLADRAESEETIDKVREESRQAVASFVRDWLLNHSAWETGQFEEIAVRFPDEEGGNLTNSPAVLKLEAEEVLP